MSKPLTALCKLDVVYELNNEILNIFNQLRTKLTTAPLLLFPDWKLPFKHYVDAIMPGLGAALHQQQVVHDILTEGTIVFISIQLNDSEGRYSASQLEFCGLVWASEQLHYYLEGSVVELITDCNL